MATKKKSKSASKKKTSRRKQPALPPVSSWWDSLSTDRKLDLLGTAMSLTGLLMLLSLFSSHRGVVTRSVVGFFTGLLGLGTYVLAAGLLALGLWLILRKMERIPALSVERVTGFILLFLGLLTVFQVFAPQTPEPDAIAGGGFIGAVIKNTLWRWLGALGAAIVVIAWVLIALVMAFDLSIPEIIRWMSPLSAAVANWWQQRKTRPQSAPPLSDEVPAPDDFMPVNRTMIPTQTTGAAAPQVAIGVTTAAPTIKWLLPKVQDILDLGSTPSVNEEFVKQRARLIEDTLASFGAPVQVVAINRGPTITQFGIEPQFIETRNGRTRVRVSKIVSLSDDLALALAAPRIRIQAPVPGHSYIGVEVPNDEMTLVSLRDTIESENFQRTRKPLSFPLGRDVAGHPIGADLTAMPHLLIAGATGSGKSVCVNAILCSFLLHNTPDDLRLILVDPKRVELTGYNGVPHLLAPVVVETERVVGALQWMTREMDKRYHIFAQVGARNITDYNARMQAQRSPKLPFLVIVIDELADLMMLAPDETERTITRLAQLARATGIHLILATQRPSVDVVTGLIKANFPARVAFAVASNTDSRVILDQPGAERLLGRGDMLYQSPDAPSPLRLQGVFVSDPEIQRLVTYWRMQMGSSSPYAAPGGINTEPTIPGGVPLKQMPIWEDIDMEPEPGDPLYDEAVDLVRREGRASVSMLQRKFRIGYTRAARLIDEMEEKGIVSAPTSATGVRDVLDYGPAAPPKED